MHLNLPVLTLICDPNRSTRRELDLWCSGWESNPQNLGFEPSTYANSVTRTNKTHSLVPKAPASVGSSCRTNSRAVFLNPQDWGVPTPTTSVSTALRLGADNRTEIFFPFKERKIISTKFLHYLSHLIIIMSNLIYPSGDK